jgi:hypothetical protein
MRRLPEACATACEAAELVERLQRRISCILDCFIDAGRLEREAETQEIARIGDRDRIDAIALARLHRDEVLALEPQQRLAHRLAAHCIAFGELLFAHIITRRQAAGQDISAEQFVDIFPQKHGISRQDAMQF